MVWVLEENLAITTWIWDLRKIQVLFLYLDKKDICDSSQRQKGKDTFPFGLH